MPSMDLFDQLKAVVGVFDERGIPYALCGGLAMAVHAVPRATIDIDVLIEESSLFSVREGVAPLGFVIEADPMRFAGGAVDIRRLTKIDPSSHDPLMLDLLIVTPTLKDVWASRQAVTWEGGALWVVSREGLKQLKRLRGSGTDMDDIEKLDGGAQ